MKYRKPSWHARLLAAAFALSLPAAHLHAQSTPAPDPTQAEVPLQCAPGWQARLVFDAGVGVWTVACAQVQVQFGCPEVIALDDRGRCTVLRSYSGKWTPQPTIEDGQWLAPVAWGDLDPTLEGGEIYTGGQGGRLWQVRPRPSAHFDCRVVGEWPGEEIHTLVLDELDPGHDGPELLVFLASGRVQVLEAGDGRSVPSAVELARLPGRVRQAVVLGSETGAAPWVATVSRSGHLDLVRIREGALERRPVAQETMGLGRITLAATPEGGVILYATRDDGLILRFAGGPDAGFDREIVYAGPQGPRGIAAGRFDADPRRECLAVFGYSAKVELLTRLPGQPWRSETIFTDIDKGHWLAAAELDGRNGTRELIGSGYGGRVFLLARPPGYGLPQDNFAVSAEVAPAPARDPAAPLRLGLRARAGGAEKLTPLRYTGGFEPKTMLYETLVRRDESGRLGPGLAAAWTFEDGGAAVRFELRAGARFHDGTPVTAEAVQEHFRRWMGLPEHDWLPCNERITAVTVDSERVLRVAMDRPWALLPDLCAVNPCAILGPGARDREGEFVRPVGTGPFRFVAELGERSWRVARTDARGRETLIDVTVFPRGGNDEPIDALLRGEIDAFVGGWDEDLPAERLRELQSDPGIRVVDAPGSSVVSLGFRLTDGPTADLGMRRHIAAAVSRAELIRRAEGGFADPCTSWAAPSLEWWPNATLGMTDADRVEASSAAATNGGTTLRIAAGRSSRTARVAAFVAEQLGRAGLHIEVVENGDADITVDASHGVPYDPHVTLVRRFGSLAGAASGVPPRLRQLVDEAARTPDEERRIPVYARIQELLDREVLMVPLYAPRRIALHSAAVDGIRLGVDVYHADVTGLRRVRSPKKAFS